MTAAALLTYAQAAEYLGVSPTTVKRLVLARPPLLPSVVIGARTRRLRVVDLDSYIDAHLVGAPRQLRRAS